MSEVQRMLVNVEMADGIVHEKLRIRNPALVAFDFERTAKGWPDAAAAPMLWQTFVTWRQLKNDGRYLEDFPTFRDKDCAEVDVVKAEKVDPTKSEDAPTQSSESLPTPESALTG